VEGNIDVTPPAPSPVQAPLMRRFVQRDSQCNLLPVPPNSDPNVGSDFSIAHDSGDVIHACQIRSVDGEQDIAAGKNAATSGHDRQASCFQPSFVGTRAGVYRLNQHPVVDRQSLGA